MTANNDIDWVLLSDSAIIEKIGFFIKRTRLNQNKTQVELANTAGLNRWTISQMENGESVTLSSLIQVLRALDVLYVLNSFNVSNEISPLEYAKLQQQQRERASSKNNHNTDLEW